MMTLYEMVVGGDVERRYMSEREAHVAAAHRAAGLTAYTGTPETVCIHSNGREIGRYVGRIATRWIPKENPLHTTTE